MKDIIDNYKEVLTGNPLFDGIPEAKIPVLLQRLGAFSKKYSKDEFVKMSGDPTDFIGMVLSGEVHICKDDFYGNRSITASVTAGSLFAEAFACAGTKQLPVDILAASDCRILYLNSKTLSYTCGGNCEFHHLLIENLLGIVARKNMYLNQKLSYTSRGTTKEKLLAYLSDQAKQNQSNEFTIPFNRQELADFLGVERSAMSAEISKLVKLGVLETQRSFFKLKYI
ncbi:MAG: Crp/Fnr family transcriptional regulator [Acetatifactor sp.]